MSHRPPRWIPGRLAPIAALALATVATPGCRPKIVPAIERAVSSCREGRYEEALATARARGEGGADAAALRDLEIAILARLGRSPEAMDAYASRTAGGEPHDALILEALVLSAFPAQMRMDPVAAAGIGERPAWGSATASALALATGKPGLGSVPQTRLAWLAGMLAVPGRDASIAALEPLAAQTSFPLVRAEALDAHAVIGTPEAAHSLGEISRRFSASTLVQQQVLDVLARFPATGASQAAGLLANENQSVRSRAAGVLAASKDPDAERLLRASGTIEARAALLARDPGEPGAADALLDHLGSLETPLDLTRFLMLVGETGGPGALPILCEAAHNEDPGVATTAIQVMARDPAPLAGSCIVDVALRATGGTMESAMTALVTAPATGREADLAKLVAGLLEQGNVPLAAAGAGALGRTGVADAEALLVEMLRSDEPRIRRASAVALLHLGHEDVLETVMEVFEEDRGPWHMLSYVEWRLLASDPGANADLLRKAVMEGNPILRDKILEALAAGLDPLAISLSEIAQLRRIGEAPLESRTPGDDRVSAIAARIVERLSLRGDGPARRRVIEDLLGSDDPYLVLTGLHLVLPADRGWATGRAEAVLAGDGDTWLRIEAARALAIIGAS